MGLGSERMNGVGGRSMYFDSVSRLFNGMYIIYIKLDIDKAYLHILSLGFMKESR